jgi:hypothetical protein
MSRIVDAINAMRMYRHKFARFPNLLFPKTFNEKVVVAKLTWRSPLLPLFVDKVLAKQFVAEHFGADLITPNLYVGDWLPPREQRNWPMPYVIKPNHASGANIFVRNEAERDWDRIEERLRLSLSRQYGRRLGEWAYRDVPRKVLVEPFVGKNGVTPLEYKFHTYGGRVGFITLTRDRYGEARALNFDRDWNVVPLQFGMTPAAAPSEPPADLHRMIDMAEAFGRRLPICRIDFYHIDGRARFGEITIYSGSGITPMTPPEFDRKLGDMIPRNFRPADHW